MKEIGFYKRKKRIVYDIIPFEEEGFCKKLLKDKPKELWHKYFSSKEPCYYITEYRENGVVYYGHNWADKNPQYKNYKNFHTELALQGMELFYYKK